MIGEAGVGQREQRHHHVAGERMEQLLVALVGRDRRAQAGAGGLGQLGVGLLAEHPEQVRGPLEVRAGRRIGDRQQAHRQPDDDRVDPGLQKRHPGDRPEHGVDAAVVHPALAGGQDEHADAQADDQRHRLHARS